MLTHDKTIAKTHSSTIPVQRPEIDGLRAFAILPVVLYHLGLGARSGYVGVDVFFVISGFLISGIILRELDSNCFTFAKFWERRVRRIVPVLLFFTTLILFAGWRILHPMYFASLCRQAGYALTGLANFKLMALSGGYWAPDAENIPLLHTWSLAVEEQYYALAPFLLWLLHRWDRTKIGFALGLIFASSLILSLACERSHPDFNFFLLPTRAWEMALGGLGAYMLHRKRFLPTTFLHILQPLGLAMILYSSIALPKGILWPSAWTLLPTVGAMLILITPAPATERHLPLVIQTLSLSPIRFIGLISYSLYLWHWPFIVFYKQYAPESFSIFSRFLLLLSSVLLSIVSWKFVEQPFRNHSKSFRIAKSPLFIGVGATWVCLMVATYFSAKHEQAARKSFLDHLPPKFAHIVFESPRSEAIKNYDATSHLQSGGVEINTRNRSPRVVVLGSSHGEVLGPVVSTLCEHYNVPCAMLTQNGTVGIFASSNFCPIAWHGNTATKKSRDEIVKGYIEKWKPDLVIIAGRWDTEIPSDTASGFKVAFTEMLKWLNGQTKQVIVLGQVPVLPLPDADNSVEIWKFSRGNNYEMPVFRESPKYADLRHQALSLFRTISSSRLTVIDPEPLFKNSDGSIRYYSDDGTFYWDEDHLNELGSLELRPLLDPFFRQLAAAEANVQLQISTAKSR